jgi:integrase
VESLALELKRLMAPPPQLGPTLEEFAPRWVVEYAQANHQKPRGIESKRNILANHLLPALGQIRLGEIREPDVQALKAALLKAGKSAKTVNNVLSVLNKLLLVAVKWGVIERCPVKIETLKTSAPPVRFYSFTELNKLRHAAKRWPEVLTTVLLAADAGLRRGEIVGLEWGDVNWQTKQLTVQRSDSRRHVTKPKSGKHRVIPMTSRLYRALRKIHHSRCKRVLTSPWYASESVSESTLRTWLAKAEKAAGLPEVGALHVLRHTFCSHLAMRGVPLSTIQQLAGHSSVSTTMLYVHLLPSEKERAIRLLESPFSQSVRRRDCRPNDFCDPAGIRTRVQVQKSVKSQKSRRADTDVGRKH